MIVLKNFQQIIKIVNPCIVMLGIILTAVSPQALSSSIDEGSAITAAELQQNGYVYPTDLVANANHTQLANYAWRLFIASNQLTTASLTSGAGRGVGSANSNFIDTGRTISFGNPLVFESLYHRTEAFPYYPSTKPPSPIDQVPTYYTYSKDSNDNKVAFTVTGQQYVNLDETNQIGQNMLYYQDSNDSDFPVLFMAKVNAIETNYVRNKTAPSASSSFVFPNDVLEVKTAWRRVRDIKNSDPSKYHQATATYYVGEAGSGNPTIVTDTFALIAIHIIQKTANYQSFIFSTFEHVDAVTRSKESPFVPTDPAYELLYSCLAYDYIGDFNSVDNATCAALPATTLTAIANGAYYINEPGQPEQANVPSSYTLPISGTVGAPQGYQTVVQPKTITKEVNDVNNQVASLITGIDPGSIWTNYRLKGVQAVPTSDQDTLDYYLANIVVESSQPGIQLFRGGVQGPTTTMNGVAGAFDNDRNNGNLSANVSVGLVENQPVPPASYTMGGCMGCHGRAQQKGRDFSFLAQASGGVGKEVDSVASNTMTFSQRHAHNLKQSKSSNYE